MKKLAKVFGVMAVVLCLALGLVACTTGTYKAEMDTTAMGGPKITMKLKLKSGGKFTLSAEAKDKDGKTVDLGDDSKDVKGTYKIDGEKITLTMEGSDVEGTIKDGKITIDIGMGSLEFKK